MRARSSEEEDYILRVIRQAAQAVRALREMLLHGRDAPSAVHARAAATIGALLGDRAELVSVMDATTAVRLVGDPRPVALWASLVELQADALDATDQVAGARYRQRADALRQAAAELWGDADPDLPPSAA